MILTKLETSMHLFTGDGLPSDTGVIQVQYQQDDR